MTTETLEVYAIRDGFYDTYRKHGAKFTIRNPDTSFSKRWMVPADTKEGRAFIQRHKQQTNAAMDAITGERLQAGGEAEQIVLLMQQLAELKAQVAASTGDTLAAKAEAAKAPADDDAKAPDEASNADDDTTPSAEAPKRRRRSAS